MAGGIGKRCWPLSNKTLPKQFHTLGSSKASLLQLTAARFQNIIPPENIWIVIQQEYKKLVQQQLPFLNEDQILCEPMVKNTAPCIGYACYKIAQKAPSATIVISPADHAIKHTTLFQKMIQKGLEGVHQNIPLIVVGATCTTPATGYGYIELARRGGSSPLQAVHSFTEKPNCEEAQAYIATGSYLWNTGILISKVTTLLDLYRQHLPSVSKAFESGIHLLGTPEEAAFIKNSYALFSNISFDYGILEKSDGLYALHYESDWSDLGTWSSLYDYATHDKQGNVTHGKIATLATKNCMIHTTSTHLIATYGVEDLVIVQHDGITMICPQKEVQNIKKLVDYITDEVQ